MARRPSAWRAVRLAAREYFAVYLTRAEAPPEAARAVVPPEGGYLADPFLIEIEGAPWLLAEAFDYRAGRGRLVAAALTGGDPPQFRDLPLDLSGHASFPFVFRFDGALYLLPETAAARVLRLYRLDGTPPVAVPVTNLLEDIDCADSALFPWRGLWWLITSVRTRPGAGRALAIYSAETPLARTWRAHPINARGLYTQAPNGTGRNAGVPMAEAGRLYRPVQTSPRYYGERMLVTEIAELTPDRFHEAPAETDGPLADLAGRVATHHATRLGGLIAFDRREPAPLGRWMPWRAPARRYSETGSGAEEAALIRAAFARL